MTEHVDAQVGCASSVQMAPDGSRRIVWMIKAHATSDRMARQAEVHAADRFAAAWGGQQASGGLTLLEVVQPAAGRSTKSALTCQSRAAAAWS